LSLHGLFAFVDPAWDKSMIWMRNTTSNAIYLCCRVLRLLILPASFLLNAKPTTTETRSPFAKPKLIMTICVYNKQLHGPFVTVGLIPITHALIWPHYQQHQQRKNKGSHNEPAPTSAPSTGCPDLLSCGWTSTELIFGFASVTNSVGNRSHT
jgi:hypothetical protein